MGCRVAEGLHLRVLGRQREYRVRGQHHQREVAVEVGVGEVADAQRHRGAAGLVAQLVEHLRGAVDPGHREAEPRQRQGQPSGADTELQYRPAVGELGQQRHGGVGVGGKGRVDQRVVQRADVPPVLPGVEGQRLTGHGPRPPLALRRRVETRGPPGNAAAPRSRRPGRVGDRRRAHRLATGRPARTSW
jgi:hypothetical protein